MADVDVAGDVAVVAVAAGTVVARVRMLRKRMVDQWCAENGTLILVYPSLDMGDEKPWVDMNCVTVWYDGEKLW